MPRKERDRGRGSASLTRLVPQRPRDIMAWPASLIPVRECQLESSRWCLPETSIRRYTPPFPVRLDLIEKNSGYIRGHRTRLVSNGGWFQEISILASLSLFFLGIFDRRGIDCIVNKWGGDSESREWGMEESVIWSVNLDMLIFRWMVTFKWMFANGSFT